MIMQSINPQVAGRIRDRKVLCILIGADELTSDLPQFATDKTGRERDFYNWRQRGFLSWIDGRPTVVFAEEDVLEYEGGMQDESILIHEFGHVIHGAGFDKPLQDRLTAAFQRAQASGIWMDGRAAQRFRRVKSEQPVSLLDALIKSFPDEAPEMLKKYLDKGDILVNGKPTNSQVKVTKEDKVLIVFGGEKECYAHKNRSEYWAEGVQYWYDTNRTMDHDHNHIHTREQLKTYDPALAELCQDVLGDTKWRFVSPRERAGKDHLQGYDPATAPKVVDPEHIETAAYDYYDKYWKDYWQRLRDKHALSRELQAEGTVALAKAVREKGSAVQGAILFTQQELGCTNCHGPEQRDLLGPDLTKVGKQATDEYLVEALLEPSKAISKGFETSTVITVEGKSLSGRIVAQSPDMLLLRESTGDRKLIRLAGSEVDEIVASKVSAMPDGLMDQLNNRQEFLDLARYLMEVAAAGPSEPVVIRPGGGTLGEELQGLVLLDDFNCTSCHRNISTPSMIPPKRSPNLAWAGGRIDPANIERFIVDPLKVKPGTTMPDVMGGLNPNERREAATAMTHYIISLNDQPFVNEPFDEAAATRGRELFHSVGCVACHSPRDDNGTERLPKSSVPLGRLEQKYNLHGLVDLLEDPHAVRPSGRMPNMRLTHWEARDISHYLLGNAKATAQQHGEGAPAGSFQLDRALAEQGKRRFSQLGCGQCHATDEENATRDFPPLTLARADEGCLSDKAGNWPRYRLDEAQHKAIRAALARGLTALDAEDQIDLALGTFRCVACHQRDNLGGVSAERNEYFQTTNENLGPQGRIPPQLTGVGVKLKPKWLREVLVSGRAIRPYLKTRMPQYGADNVGHLVDLFQQTDNMPAVAFARVTDQKQMRDTGHELAGNTGLNCIACHTFQLKPAATMPAVDLTEMTERLHKEWFYHYLRDPQRLSPNTVMPSFWPRGRAIRKDILDGDAGRQIEALWQYLSDGRQARIPKGLVRQRMELVATDEAVMLRRSYPGVGKRGIGVGYRRHVNLVFDAQQMRLAMIWKGKFADPGGVWTGQGHGNVHPLGTDVLKFAPGPELDDANEPWPVDEGRPPKHRFLGYSLDDERRPMLRYRYDGIDVEDYPQDVVDADSQPAFIQRTVTVISDRQRSDIAFRAASGENITAEGDGTFLIDNKLRIHVDDQHTPHVVDAPTGKQLRIPLNVARGRSTLILQYKW
jgi:putative heme-binding domain-containing protein